MALALIACGGGSVPAAADPLAGNGNPEARLREVIRIVSEIRGLPERTPIVIRNLDDAAFERAFAAKQSRELRPKDKDARLMKPDIYLGFYDQFEKVIALRENMPNWARDVEPLDLLAHEVEHALQDQHFGIPDVSKIDNDDELMAIRAALEGDAELTLLGFRARRLHVSAKRAMARGSGTTEVSSEFLVRVGVFAPNLLNESPFTRETVVFPYVNGTKFASAIYRAGGVKLLNATLRNFPKTTEQIIHPEKYIGGEIGASIDRFALPRFQMVQQATLGELKLRTIFSRCLSWQEATGASLDWAGDRAFFVREPKASSPKLMLLLTTWDSEAAASRFEAAVRRCFPESNAEAVQRNESSVLVAQGATLLPGERRALFEMIHAAPSPQSAFGSIAIPPPPLSLEEEPAHRGQVRGNAFQNPWLGLTVPNPIGYRVKTDAKQIQLLVARATMPTAIGVFTVMTDPEVNLFPDKMHLAFVEGLVSAMKGAAKPTKLKVDRSRVAGGERVESLWTFTKKHVEGETAEKKESEVWTVKFLTVPTCDGAAMFQWGTTWIDPGAEGELDAWRSSFHFEPSPPACADIRSENRDVP